MLLRRRLLRSFLLPVMLAGAPLSASGCSFLFVESAPPPDRRVGLVKCTTSSVPPVLDLVVVAMQAFRFFQAATENEVEYRNDRGISPETGIWLSLGVGTLHASSAIWGFNNISHCREAKDVEEQEAEEDAARARAAAKQARAAAAEAKAAGDAAAAASGSAAPRPAAQPDAPAPATP